MKLTKKEEKRYREIVRELSKLSRDGWAHAKRADYAGLEAELKLLADKRDWAR